MQSYNTLKRKGIKKKGNAHLNLRVGRKTAATGSLCVDLERKDGWLSPLSGWVLFLIFASITDNGTFLRLQKRKEAEDRKHWS